ncbi:hypothetical protein ACFL11_00100 [Patescibacteria group bacterium]
MILTAHILTGAAIVTKTQNPFLGLLFAFLSHYLLDFLPHNDYSEKLKNIKERRWKKSFFDFSLVILDFSFGVLLVFLFSKNLFLSLVGGFFAVLPDTFSLLHFLFHKNKLLNKYYIFQKEKLHYFNNKKVSVFWQTLVQASVILISIFFLL